MPNNLENMTPGQILAEASVADFISRLGLGIAEAQRALDENSIKQLAEFVQPRPGLGGRTLLDLGLMPAFYHYQSADLSCSLQLSIKVAENIGFDLNLNGSYNNAGTSSDSSHNTTSSTESGSSTSHTTRSAQLTVHTSTTGALTVNGQNFQLTGGNPQERITQLASALRGNASTGVSRVAMTPPSQAVNPTVDPTHPQIVTSSNAVAFMAGGTNFGIIEIEAVPAAPETFTLNTGVTVTTVLQPDLQAYANDVASRIQALGYATRVVGSGSQLSEVHFDFDQTVIREQPHIDASRLRNAARFLNATRINVRVLGYTDRSGPDAYNRGLGDRRVASTMSYLSSQGVRTEQLQAVASTGEQRWADAGAPDNVQNEAHRMAELVLADTPKRYIIVEGDATHVLANVTPDHTGGPAAGNGFVYLGGSQPVDLTTGGRKAVIHGVDFPLRGTASGSLTLHSGEAYAKNLADDVNAHPTVAVKAWATGHVCYLALAGDNFALELITTETRDISLSATDDITVTSAFTRSATTDQTTQSTGNRTVAVGASLDLRFSRQFEQNVTGNSTISAKLVAIPAPPEFLSLVKTFLTPGAANG